MPHDCLEFLIAQHALAGLGRFEPSDPLQWISIQMACGDQTLFVQSDEIVGNPYAANFVAQLLPMYQVFNAELKAEVEGQS